jgi:hypothetical protein
MQAIEWMMDFLFFCSGTEAAELAPVCRLISDSRVHQLQAAACERVDMTRMVMMWMFGVPLSVLVLLKVFGIL